MRKLLLASSVATFLNMLAVSSWAVAAPTCDEQFTATTAPRWKAPKVCAEYDRGMKSAYREYTDGSAIPNQRLTKAVDDGPPTPETFKETETLVRITKASPSKTLATKKFVETVRAELLEQIKQGASDEALSSVQKFLLKRVKSMSIKFDGKDGNCERLSPEAFYDNSKNTLVVCSNIMNYPNEALLPAIAHEMGHAADPCAFEGFFIPRSKALQSEKSRIAAFRKCGLPKDYDSANSRQVAELMKSGEVLDIDKAPQSAPFARCEFMKRQDSGLKAEDLAKSPFADAFSCVDRAQGAGQPGAAEQKYASLFNMMAHVGMSATEKAAAKPIDLGLAQNFTCSRKTGEMYADRVGAKLTAGYLAKNRAALSEEKMKDMVYALAVDSCEQRADSRNYSDSNDRVRALLQYPELQQAVGCSGLATPPICPEPQPAGANGSQHAPTSR